MYCFITDWAISWSNFNLSWIEFLWRALEGLNMFHWTWFDKSSFVCSVSFSILVSTGYHSTFLLNVRRTNTRSDWREKSTEKNWARLKRSIGGLTRRLQKLQGDWLTLDRPDLKPTMTQLRRSIRPLRPEIEMANGSEGSGPLWRHLGTALGTKRH